MQFHAIALHAEIMTHMSTVSRVLTSIADEACEGLVFVVQPDTVGILVGMLGAWEEALAADAARLIRFLARDAPARSAHSSATFN